MNIQNRQTDQIQKINQWFQGWEEGEWRMTANGHGVSWESDKIVLKLDSGDGCTNLLMH